MAEFGFNLKELEAMPAVLRRLLDDELAAGNGIAEIGHSFPAPPVGAYVKLTKPLVSRARQSGDGIDYYDRNNSTYSGEITDAKRFYFLLEPSHAAPSQPDVNVSRATFGSTGPHRESDATQSPALIRFQDSMVMNYEKWHDGIGYDLKGLSAMSAAEKQSAEAVLVGHGVHDWRDIEALACLDSPRARAVIRVAIDHANPEVRSAVTRFAPHLIAEPVRIASLVRGLESADLFGGLTQTLEEVAGFHPPLVVAALLRGALNRSGEVAVHFAAMLCFIQGQARQPFDLEQRPFFLRFNTAVRGEREAVFTELCERIGLNPAPYLTGANALPSPVHFAAEPPDYTVEVDVRGEMLTYCEINRSAHVICTFGGAPCIASATLSKWLYPRGRRSEKMSAEERQVILVRIADYCRKHHGLANLVFED